MFLRKLFPYSLSACFLIAILSISVEAQSATDNALNHLPYDQNEITCSPEDVALMAVPSVEEPTPAKSIAQIRVGTETFRQLMTEAIDERLGSRYRWGGTGRNGFDCSGFVWSVFQSAGINFERGSARALWGRFEAPAPEERFRFGTLVFFSNLAHVGVVVDENGFYHASRHHGVVYSPFNDYWVSRIDGFKKVPLPVEIVRN